MAAKKKVSRKKSAAKALAEKLEHVQSEVSKLSDALDNGDADLADLAWESELAPQVPAPEPNHDHDPARR